MFVNPLPLPGARRSVTDPRRSRDVHASSRTGFRRNARLENVPACRGVRLVPRWKGTVFGKCEGDERWQGIAKFDNAHHAADLIAGNNINKRHRNHLLQDGGDSGGPVAAPRPL